MCIGLFVVGGLLLLRTAQTSTTQVARSVPIYDARADARADITDALAQAQRKHKLVLIDFGADWCLDCVVLANHFDDPQVKPFLDAHYVAVRVNVGEWDANLDVAQDYGDPIAKGIPAIVVVGPDAQIVASTGGGELANARTSSKDDILSLLQQWVAQS
jgi:thiol:disulfide interchange protein